MEIVTLDLTSMAHGGAAIGKDKRGRPVFVPYGIPGEKVRVAITDDKKKYAHAEIVEILKASPDRVEPRCPHFGPCGGCHFQHMRYEAQLKVKQDVVADQLERVGGLKKVRVRPTLPNPNPYAYRIDMILSPAAEGGLGYWSPALQEVIPIQVCPISHPRLVELKQDVDLDLPGLRKLILRIGVDEALLAAIEVEGVEPPELEADFPVSVAIVLPDNTAASLVGDHYIVQAVKGRDFRVSPGCFFYPSPPAAEHIVDTTLKYAALNGTETVVEAYSGVGTLTAFLSAAAGQVIAVEVNPDAVADAAVNLEDTDNVSVYQGYVEDVLPTLDVRGNVMVVHP
ncbi:MAG TPA: TRAM domain-containing protein, partial [Anaerolineae bacterium]